MSTCISREGQYSAHETQPGQYICDRCGVLDEDGIVAEVERLTRWKAEATEVILGLQDVGKALGLRLGERITGESAVEAAEALRNRAEHAEANAAAALEFVDIRTRAHAWMAHLGYTPDDVLTAERWRAPLDPAEEYEVPAAVRDLDGACDFAREYEAGLRAIIEATLGADQ